MNDEIELDGWDIDIAFSDDEYDESFSDNSEDDTFDRVAFYRQHPELLGVLNPRFDDDETDDDDAFGNLADYRYENAKDK